MKRIFTSILFIIIGLFTMNFQCGKDYEPVKNKYWFKENAEISPYRKNYQVGDTLYINVSIPDKKMYDTLSQKIVHYDSANIQPVATVHLVYNNPLIYTGPFADFLFPGNVTGSVQNGGSYTSSSIAFGCSPSTDYSLSLGVVLLQAGTFELSFAGGYMSKCFTNQFDYTGITFAFDVSDTHLSDYQKLPLDSIGVAPDPNVIRNLENKSSVLIEVQ